MREYERFRNEVDISLNELLQKNKKIYFDSVPEPRFLPKINPFIKVSPLEIPEIIIPAQNEYLNSLILKGMNHNIKYFKTELCQYISEKLNNFERKEGIEKFLYNANINTENVLSDDPIVNSLNCWKKYINIKIKGDINFLFSVINKIENVHEDILNRVRKSELLLYV